MKKSYLMIVLLLMTVGLAACVPNRLNNSLVTREPGSTPDLGAPAPTPDGRNLQPQLANANIPLGEVVALLPPDAIPAILPEDAPQIFVSADAAEAAGMNPNVRVLGVHINGESHAYPLPYMSEHEIVNDVIGGVPIATTW